MEYQKFGPMNLVSKLSSGRNGRFKLYYFEFQSKGYYVLEKGEINGDVKPLVRIVSACSIGHIFNSRRCDCRKQLDLALEKINNERLGLLIYAFNQEGRGAGVKDHFRAWIEQDKGYDTVDAYFRLGLPVDSRDYSDIIEIIKSYRISSLRLLTNNPKKIEIFKGTGIHVKREPLNVTSDKFNKRQMVTKRAKLHHLLK